MDIASDTRKIEEERVESSGLVYVGKIIKLDPIPNADFVLLATVVCGFGGKWRGVVRKPDFEEGSRCVVYLPDALIPPNEEMKFMEASKWRVTMRRFKGAPSEVVIMPVPKAPWFIGEVGSDLTKVMGVTKYTKELPPNLNGKAIGLFPGFIPKTDEPNYQRHPELVEALKGLPFYITEKCDGSSTTAYRYKDKFGVCSRNLELKKNENNGFWQMALKYNLEEKLPEGTALQWETCGPKIQNNPMGLNKIQAFAFSAYDIRQHRYLNAAEFFGFCDMIQFPRAKLVGYGRSFDGEVETLGEGTYDNGMHREGVVVRSQENMSDGKPISFKVINLNYGK